MQIILTRKIIITITKRSKCWKETERMFVCCVLGFESMKSCGFLLGVFYCSMTVSSCSGWAAACPVVPWEMCHGWGLSPCVWLSVSLTCLPSSALSPPPHRFAPPSPRRQAPCRERARPQHPPAEQHLAQELRVHAGAGRSGRRSGGQRASSHPGGDAGADPAQGQREEAGGRLARRHQG